MTVAAAFSISHACMRSSFQELRQLVGAGARSLMTYVPLPGDGRPHTVTLIPGDGVGPEVTEAVVEVVEALGAPIIWERCAGSNDTSVSRTAVAVRARRMVGPKTSKTFVPPHLSQCVSLKLVQVDAAFFSYPEGPKRRSIRIDFGQAPTPQGSYLGEASTCLIHSALVTASSGRRRPYSDPTNLQHPSLGSSMKQRSTGVCKML